MFNPAVSRRQFVAGSAAAAGALALAGCGGGNSTGSSANKAASNGTHKAVWAQGASGNVLVSIAKDQGYFDELGVEIEEIPLDDGQLAGVRSGTVDIASNSGTYEPLQMICSGDDMAIIGGFMLTGCMPVVTREDMEWKSPEDFLGKKVGDNKSRYALFHSLVEAGHDIDKEIEWKNLGTFNYNEKMTAVRKGEVDFVTIGTGSMYELEHTEGIKIVTYCSDVTPNYSCCRMVARNSWVKENKETVKLINVALIRAQNYFEQNKEKCVDLMADQLGATKAYVEAYMLNEHYRINPDTVKNIVMDNYNYMVKIGGIEDIKNSVNPEEYIYNDLYKEALDEAVSKYSSENKTFYDNAVEFYKKYNS